MKKVVNLFIALFCVAISVNATNTQDNDVTATDAPKKEKITFPAKVDINNQEMMDALFADCEWESQDGTGALYHTFNADGTGSLNEYGAILNFKWQYDAETHKLSVTLEGGKRPTVTVVTGATPKKIAFKPLYGQNIDLTRCK